MPRSHRAEIRNVEVEVEEQENGSRRRTSNDYDYYGDYSHYNECCNCPIPVRTRHVKPRGECGEGEDNRTTATVVANVAATALVAVTIVANVADFALVAVTAVANVADTALVAATAAANFADTAIVAATAVANVADTALVAVTVADTGHSHETRLRCATAINDPSLVIIDLEYVAFSYISANTNFKISCFYRCYLDPTYL